MRDTQPVRANRRSLNFVTTILFAGVSCGWAAGPAEVWLQRLHAAPSGVVLAGGVKAVDTVKVERVWDGNVCSATVKNEGASPVRIERIDLFDFKHGLPGSTPFYGESFQMLAQNIGTLADPKDMGSSYPDRKHYRLYEVPGLRTARGMMVLRPTGAEQILLGFTSCRRFDGLLSFDAERLVVSFDCEGLELAPGASWQLEEFYCAASPSREALLDGLCERIERHHPRRTGFKVPPLGWCSWYCFGPNVTVPDIRQNLDWIAANAPQLRYIQIDDGYQPWMGDWLESGKSFGGDIRAVLGEIRQRGFEPAIWLAPFIASPESKLFRDHPDWFVKDADGKPLRSDKVGFGGWRLGPWYVLDGTHPGAQGFIEKTFRTMRRDWGCTYFKLDANYWGALNKGRFHDPKATRIEAYRRGMEAALRGAGDAFILGCNHPIWPSLGLVDGARVSNDLARNWTAVRDMARQSLLRGWQNGRFWWNDPDCALLHSGMLMDISGKMLGSQAMPWNEVIFHATAAHATGGLLLSGDNLPQLKPEELGVLRKLIPPTGRAASFADEALAIGRTPKKGGEYLYLFNWGDKPVEREVSLPGRAVLKNYWTGEDLGTFEGIYRVPALPPHSALLIESTTTEVPAFRSGAKWLDDAGVPINAHGGGILFQGGTYYWFGEHKVAGTVGNSAQVGVSVYSSRDLCSWKNGGIALKVSEDPKSEIVKGCIIERPKVIHNAKTGKYVMWFHLEIKDQGYMAARSGVAVADKATGPYSYLGSFRPNAGIWPLNVPCESKKALTDEEVKEIAKLGLTGGYHPGYPQHKVFRRDFTGGQMARDMTLFVDDDGMAYHIYSSEENGTLHISQLSDDYLKPAGRYIRIFPGDFNEAPTLFKHNGKYYLISSGCSGWAPNAARSAVADSILGEWRPLGNPVRGTQEDRATTFRTQGTYVLPVQGCPGGLIFMADRWCPENAIDGRYVWLPVEWEQDKPVLKWRDEWVMNTR